MGQFRQAVQSERLAVSAELTLQRESTAEDVKRQAEQLARFSDGIQVTDNPYAWVQMSAVAASALLLDQGLDPVPVLTCRDRSRRVLESDLNGLQALGVDSLMLMRGHRVPVGHAVGGHTVFELTGRELIGLAADRKPLKGSEGFFIGTGVRLFRADKGWRADSLRARAGDGASFLQTQLCYNMGILRHYLERFQALDLHKTFRLVVSLSPLPSAETARWVRKNLRDSRIPVAVIKRLEDAKNEEEEGLRICAETMEEVAQIPGVSGVNLMTTGDPEAIKRVVQAAGLRPAN